MSEGTIARTFLGWDTSLVHGIAEHLLTLRPAMDFSGVSLVVSGGRAGRRVLVLLAERAIAEAKILVPPHIFTAGSLAEKLYSPTAPQAGRLARQMAWVAALHKAEPHVIAPLFPKLAAAVDLPSLHAAARLIDRCSQDLAAGLLDFADLVNRAAEDQRFGRPERWQAAAALQQSFRDELQSAGLCDAQYDRNGASKAGAARSDGTVILAGVAELTPQLRALLSCAADHEGDISVLVYAPPHLADGFDDFGCVRPEFWQDHPIDLGNTSVRIVQKITEQAEETFAAIARAGSGLRTDQITICLGSEALVPYLQTTAANLADVPVRYGAGRLVSTTRPCQLLSLVSRYLQTRRFSDFAALVRNADIEQALRRYDGDDGAVWRDWRSLLDFYAGNYLPDRLDMSCAIADGWLGEPPTEPGRRDDRADLAWLFCRVNELLGERLLAAIDENRVPAEWAEAILAVLHRVYGRAPAWDQKDEGSRLVVMACHCLRDVLDELQSLPAVNVQLTAPDAIALVQSLVAGQRIPPSWTGKEIEMVGWLELAADDAEYLVITGFNEGSIPEPAGADAFLTDTVRAQLNLGCDRDRCARDAYLLTAMVQSRGRNAVTLIAGRRSADGDPLLPSRLLFRGGAGEVASRVLQSLKPVQRAKLAYRLMPGTASQFPIGAQLAEKIADITSMRVTSFKEYLSSPQGFYLRHVLKLDTMTDSAPRELDAMQCGNLVHEVMNAFAAAPEASSTSVQQCQDAMMKLLDAQVTAMFGQSTPPGAVRFQVELIRKRLMTMGEKQAKWAGEGWRIVHSEWQSAGQPGLAVDGTPMFLRGRIDRIDRCGDEWAVLDYKVGTGEKDPHKTHFARDQWCDLQLPLYRHLAAEVIGQSIPKLGYIAISDRDGATGMQIADWDSGQLDDADEAARQVVRKVRNKEFTEIGDYPPADGSFAHIFGRSLLVGAEEVAS